MSPEEHYARAPQSVTCAIITVSDTRAEGDDPSGDIIATKLDAVGQKIESRHWVRDEPDAISALLDSTTSNVVVLTGGTGLNRRDLTWKVVRDHCDEPLPAFSTLFALLSHRQVGSAALLSRAWAGLRRNPPQILFALPGSPEAVEMAMDELILPQLGHLVEQVSG